MVDANAFLEAIRKAPEDDTPRLVYADWLEEHGDDARAEFIRIQCTLAGLPADDPGRPALSDRERALLAAHRDSWVAALPAWARRECVFRRGFVARVSATAVQWLKGGEAVVRQVP